jgi:crotonobetainyl-CoA:carnitine CoA-transferase CaiB-like acyl-CoA transferase
MSKPLENIRILDLTQFLAGSYATMVFAGLGAEVIKIERPGSGEPARLSPPYAGPCGINLSRQTPDDISLSILKRCRNKKAISLNLNSPKGKDLFLSLVAKADVVIENFRPGTMEKLGLSYPRLAEANPKVVYCSLTGFGKVKAYADLPAFDIVIQALAGSMSTNGYPDGPPTKTGIAISDLAGGLFACIATLAALENRHVTGKGQEVSVSMMESVLSLLLDEAPDFWLTQGQPMRAGNRLTRLTPFNAYQAKDGHFVIASGSNDHWQLILKAIKREDLAGDERYKEQPSRIKLADEVDGIINAWAKKVSVKEALAALEPLGIPCGPVREIPEVVSDKHLIDGKILVPVTHPVSGEVPLIKAAALPMHFSASESGFDRPAPAVGCHNGEIYGQMLGLTAETMAALKSEKVI